MSGATRALRLYRSILREHQRKLPPSMRMLGDSYVKKEFRLHKSAKPEFIGPFLAQWDDYLVTLACSTPATMGKDLPPEELERLKQDKEKYSQLQQLKEQSLGRGGLDD